MSGPLHTQIDDFLSQVREGESGGIGNAIPVPLDHTKQINPGPTLLSGAIEDFLKAKVTPQPEPSPHNTRPLYLATQMIKTGAGGFVKGLTAETASISDWIWKKSAMLGQIMDDTVRNSNMPIMSELWQLSNPDVQKAIEDGLKNSAEQLKSGTFSSATQTALARRGRMMYTRGNPLGHVVANIPEILSQTPEAIGKFIGSLPANALGYSAAAEKLGVGAATSLGSRFLRSLSASSLSTAAQTGILSLKDGEASVVQVVRDLGINAAFEVVGFPLLKRAWKDEVGKGAEELIQTVVNHAGVPREVAEAKLTQIRAGSGTMEPDLADAIVKTASRNPAMAKTPIVVNAKNALSEYWNGVVPNDVKVNAKLGPSAGVTFDVEVDGQVRTRMNISGSAQDPTAFSGTVDKVASRITELSAQGSKVRLMNIEVSNGGAYSRFLTRLRGESAKYGKMDSRELSDFEKSLGTAAPRNTVAELGTIPPADTRVMIDTPNGRVAATVNKVQPGDPGVVAVQTMATSEEKVVSTNQVRVWLQEKKTPIRPTAHPDGQDRRLLFDLNSKEAFFEGVGTHHEPNNFFRSEGFSQIDREDYLNNGPRGFVHQDGSITLSVTQGERLTQYSNLSPDSGPIDSVQYRKNKPKTPYMGKMDADYSGPTSLLGPIEGAKDARVVSRSNTPSIPTIQEKGKLGTKNVLDASGAGPGEVGAGYVPRAQRDFDWERSPTGQWEKTRRAFSSQEQLHVPVVSEEAVPPVNVPVTAAARQQSRKLTREPMYLPHEVSDAESYVIPKRPLLTDPALVDAKKAAQIMLTKNIDGATPLRVIASKNVHSVIPEDFTWTVDEMAKAEFGLSSVPDLRAAGVERGYKVIIGDDGNVTTLRDMVNGGTELNFNSRIEAASYLSKQRVPQLGPKLEEKANQILKLGWLQNTDSAIDGGDFVTKDVQALTLDSLIQGKRAGVKIWVDSKDVLDASETRLANAQNTLQAATDPKERAKLQGIVDTLTASAPTDVRGIYSQLRTIEDRMGAGRGTLRVMDLGTQQAGKNQLMVYRPDNVEKLRRMIGQDAERLLAIPARDNDMFVKGLASREAGLDIMSSPDPVSSLIYAHAKNTNQRSLMEAGKVTEDPVSGRTYRIYDPETKAKVLDPSRIPCPK